MSTREQEGGSSAGLAGGVDRGISRVWSIGIALVGCVLIEAALVFNARRTGDWLMPLTGPFVWAVAMLLLHFLCAFPKSRASTRGWQLAIRIGFWLAVALALAVRACHDGTPRAMFERLVLHPMPASVRDFQWRGGVGIDGFYVIRFAAAPDDVRHVIAVRHLVPSTNLLSAEEINRRTSEQCAWLHLSFTNLAAPVVYVSPQDYREQLVTDGAHELVYLSR